MLLPGFDDAVQSAQRIFRAALDAMSRPGTVRELAEPCGVPQGLSPALSALLLTLADADTPVWLPPGTPDAVRAFLRFHCGCPLVDDAGQAAFVAVPAGCVAPALAACAQGDPAYPDRSATLLLEVASLSDGPAVTLRGPGIEHEATLAAQGLPADFWTQWHANQARFPLGVDVLLTSGHALSALPRTTQAEL
ncbi:phosphonate C-P lyase system protein PhnH [Cupriavidus sp. 2TAF22]|uniref:phosphonate C-P lyase system protein PhnH n=1 Tax=unclassified Cupriavidus TaxID=2640874 RepID=UPI003F93B181